MNAVTGRNDARLLVMGLHDFVHGLFGSGIDDGIYETKTGNVQHIRHIDVVIIVVVFAETQGKIVVRTILGDHVKAPILPGMFQQRPLKKFQIPRIIKKMEKIIFRADGREPGADTGLPLMEDMGVHIVVHGRDIERFFQFRGIGRCHLGLGVREKYDHERYQPSHIAFLLSR